MKTKSDQIKDNLETVFMMPFDVIYSTEHQEPVFLISPQSDLNELFSVKITLRQRIRLVIEVEPQKYAAAMVEAINNAGETKRRLFLEYIKQIRERKADIEFYINKQAKNEAEEGFWCVWNSFRIRTSVIVIDLLEQEDELQVIQDWARIHIGLMLSLLDVESADEERHVEGRITQVVQNRYERNPVNRELCLSANGYTCKICGFDFENYYGTIGHGFIHVHHIQKVSSFGGEYYLDPVVDLIPVCPNCHAMLHKEDPPMAPEKLRQIIENNRK